MTTITIDRAVFDAMRDALQIADNIALLGSAYSTKSIGKGFYQIREAIDASKAVEPK